MKGVTFEFNSNFGCTRP